jgi:hypothetical protein
MRKYSYHGLNRFKVIASQFTGLMAILIFTSFVGFLLFTKSKMPESSPEIRLLEDPKVTLVCLIIYILIISWGFGLTLINILPTIWVGNEGVVISVFFFFRILIQWKNIIDINTGRIPSGYTLVRTRKITPFHRVYGWFYSRTFYPSFLIGKGITGRENLISEIKQRIQ